MFNHLLKLIWNRKRKHALLITELFLSFMVFFAVLSFAIYNFNHYRMPLGFNYEDIWVLSINWGEMEKEDAWEKIDQIQQQLKQYPEIINHSTTGFSFPFIMRNNRGQLKNGDKGLTSDHFETDIEYANTLEMPVIEGRWFNEEDLSNEFPPVILNKVIRDSLFSSDEPAVGKMLTYWGDRQVRVVGIVDKFRRQHEFQSPQPALFFLYNRERHYAPSSILIKASASADVVFEEKMMKALSNIAPEVTYELEYLDDKRIVANRFIVIPLVIMTIICGFLIFNVALGLFGVLWYTINQRRAEIGLRQAMGSTSNGVGKQFVGEMWILAGLGVLIGVFFAIQFPIMKVFDVGWGVYSTAIFSSILLIFIITTICAIFPSKQAATIQPAIALREE